MELKKALRKQAKIKLALQGPNGSGKTMSALILASGMVEWGKIAVVDTENHSADLYVHLGNYNMLQLSQPFSPERYIEAIETCEKAGMDVIIIDSNTHEWDGNGGILDVHGNMPGNSFTNWAKMTSRHNSLKVDGRWFCHWHHYVTPMAIGANSSHQKKRVTQVAFFYFR